MSAAIMNARAIQRRKWRIKQSLSLCDQICGAWMLCVFLVSMSQEVRHKERCERKLLSTCHSSRTSGDQDTLI